MKTRHLFLIISFFVALSMACSPDPLPEDPDNGQTEQPSDDPSDTTEDSKDDPQIPKPEDEKEDEDGKEDEGTEEPKDETGGEDGTEDETGNEDIPENPVPAVAPVFSVEMEDGWAAVATLSSDRQNGASYWISKTQDGEPIEGFSPVDMSSMEKDTKVKLYPYFSSEHIAATGVQYGETLYLVSQVKTASETLTASIPFTCSPDPLEVVIYDDALNPSCTGGLAGWNTAVEGDETRDANWTDDKFAGSSCIKMVLDGADEEFAIKLWDNVNGSDLDMSAQAQALYNIEFYVKADKDIKGNAYFAIRYYDGSNLYMSKNQSAWQNFTSAPPGTTIPADTWTKISIPMNQIWLSTKIANEDYKGYNDDGSRSVWLYNYKKIERFYILQGSNYTAQDYPSVFLIDHFVIRKCTL